MKQKDVLMLSEKLYYVLEDLKDYIDKYGHYSGDLESILYQLENIKSVFDRDYNVLKKENKKD